MKKNILSKIFAGVLVGAMALSFVGAAPADSLEGALLGSDSPAGENTVYVMTGADGAAEKLIATRSVIEALPEGKDKLPLCDSDGNTVERGGLEALLPVSMKISCRLDGKEISPEKLIGKSGRVTLRFDYENLCRTEAEVNGKTEEIYVPFAVMTGLMLDNSVFSNVEISSGKLLSDGSRTIALSLALPGMQENLGLDRDAVEIPDYVEVSADTENFSLPMTLTAVTGSFLDSEELDSFSGLDNLGSAAAQLNSAMEQLLGGSSELYTGLCTLLDKAGALSAGAGKLAEGLSELDANSAALNSGAGSVFGSLLSMADKQISAAGLSASALTPDNYAEVLSGLIASLDETAVYEAALGQVTAAVEAQRETVRAAVTEAVRAQVEAKVREAAQAQLRESVEAKVRENEPEIRAGVIDTVRGQVQAKVQEAARETVLSGVLEKLGLTREEYESKGALEKAVIDKAVDLKMNSAEIQEQISQKTESQMQTGEVQAIIESQTEAYIQKLVEENMQSQEAQAGLEAAVKENTEAQMQTAQAQSAIEENTELQIKKLIADNMASEEVRSKLEAAAEGAQSLIELKAGLDGYAGFYYGLLTYTNGVSTAAAGARALNGGVPALMEGVTALKDGAGELSDGLVKFKAQGIGPLTEVLSGELGGFGARLRACAEAAEDYLSGTPLESLNGQVNFIYRSEEIE